MRYVLAGLLLCLGVASSSWAEAPTKQEVVDYFCEIALKEEFEDRSGLKKWNRPIRALKAGTWSKEMSSELDLIISEINATIGVDRVAVTRNRSYSNFIIFLGPAAAYQEWEPKAENLDENFGYFYVTWNPKMEIFEGSMYVDTERTFSQTIQKHLLREELTQALGLMNDAYSYPDSIFYAGSSSQTKYSSLDRRLIRLLHHPALLPGMKEEDVRRVLKVPVKD